MTPHDELLPRPLEYAAPGLPARDAQFRPIFWYVAPAGLFLTGVATAYQIEALYPNGDSRNFMSPCCAIVMAPVALILLFPLTKEVSLPNGRRFLWQAALC